VISAIICQNLVTHFTEGTPQEVRRSIADEETIDCWRYTEFGKKLIQGVIFLDEKEILCIREESEASLVEGL